MMSSVPRQSLRGDEPLVGQRVTRPHFRGVVISKAKLVVQRVREIDINSNMCYRALRPKDPARRQADKGSSVTLEVHSVLYGVLADEDLTEMVMDAAYAAKVENLERLRAEFQLRLADYRSLEQYGFLDQWDYDTS